MKTLKSKSNKVKEAFSGVSVAAMTAIMTIMPAYADQISQQINGGLKKVYGIITAIVLPLGAIAAAICAVKMIIGDERETQAAKKTLIRIIIGVGLVYLAPFLVETISGWFSGTSSSIW